MYYPDLQSYRYGLPVELPGVLTVGWLSSANEFPTRKPSQEMLDAIKRLLISNRINKMRGYHLCEFCRSSEPVKVELAQGPLILGSAEIWVTSSSAGHVYAAPDLIYHYVSVHNYAAPENFLAAVAQAETLTQWSPSEEREKRVHAALAAVSK